MLPFILILYFHISFNYAIVTEQSNHGRSLSKTIYYLEREAYLKTCLASTMELSYDKNAPS